MKTSLYALMFGSIIVLGVLINGRRHEVDIFFHGFMFVLFGFEEMKRLQGANSLETSRIF